MPSANQPTNQTEVEKPPITSVGKAIADDLLVDFLIAHLHEMGELPMIKTKIASLKNNTRAVVKTRLKEQEVAMIFKLHNTDSTRTEFIQRLEHLEHWTKCAPTN